MTTESPTRAETKRARLERRTHPRRQVPVPAYLIRAGLKPRRCLVVDVSATGVQLEIGRYPVTPGKRVQIVFVREHGSVSTVRRVAGIVVRRTKKQIGVVFLRRLSSARHST